MITAVKKSDKDYMGFTWFEIFENNKTTGYSYNALNELHAVRIHLQGQFKNNNT